MALRPRTNAKKVSARRLSYRGYVLVGSVLMGAVGVAAASGTAQAAIPVKVACTNVDPYSVSAQHQTACGDQRYPLIDSTTITSGPAAGATVYHYDEKGVPVTVTTPPAGFDAATATPAQLQAYGIMKEPAASDPAARAMWRKMIDNMHFLKAPSYLISTTASAQPDSTHWSGIVNTGNAGSFASAAALWVEPSDYGCTGGSAVYWTGLDGIGNTGTPLAQNGTAVGTNIGQDQAWWEILPEIGSIQPVAGMYATPGYAFVAETAYEGNDTVDFFWYNYYNGTTITLTEPGYAYQGDTADYIVERPEYPGGVYGSLTDFSTITFYLTITNGVASNDYPAEAFTMTSNGLSNGTILAAPYGYTTNGAFFDLWEHCD